MIVAIPKRHGRGMGDAVDDILAGADSDPLQSKPAITSALSNDQLMVPAFAASSSASPPISTGASAGNNSSAWSWSDIGRTFVAGLTQGLLKPLAPTPVKPVSSGISTPVLVAGGLAVVGLAVILLRRSA